MLDELNPHVPRELALAVAMALAIDQEDRPADTMVFAEALRNGAHGIEPATVATARTGSRAMTQVLPGRGSETAATNIGPRTEAGAGARPGPVRRLEARPYAGAAFAGPVPEPVAEPRRSSSAARRFFALLALALLFAAAVGTAVVISTSTSNTVVKLRTTFSHDVNHAVNQVQSLINQYTK